MSKTLRLSLVDPHRLVPRRNDRAERSGSLQPERLQEVGARPLLLLPRLAAFEGGVSRVGQDVRSFDFDQRVAGSANLLRALAPSQNCSALGVVMNVLT